MQETSTATTSNSSGQQRWNEFLKRQTELEETTKKLKDNLNKTYTSIEDQLAKLKNQEKEFKELNSRSSLSSSSSSTTATTAGISGEEQQLKTLAIKSLKKLNDELLPTTGSMFVRLFLGQVNVKHYREGDRFRLKQEYQKFKRKTDPLFILFVVVQLFIARNRALEILFQVWLLYYYTTLALRENILQVNGSNINQWWIIHHYLSMAISITILTWSSDSSFYTYFLPQFLYFSLFQGAVQVMQNVYQSSKLYNLIALGKAGRMDVTSEVGSSVTWDLGCSPGLTFLFPFLLFVQSFQLYNSYTLLKVAFTNIQTSEWQVFACGFLFLALGFGNLSTTLYTYGQKLKAKKS